MRIKSLTKFLEVFEGNLSPWAASAKAIRIAGASSDSKKVKKDFLFFALYGRRVHGASFISEALKNGARTILAEEPLPQSFRKRTSLRQIQGEVLNVGGALFSVKNLSQLIGKISNWIYDDPSKDLTLVAITGTNGKTTIAYMLEAIAKQKKMSCGVLGTVSYRVKSQESPASLTTPQPDEIIRYLDLMREKKCQVCFMEATSQALDMGRLQGLSIDGALFTNLTRDHLDYHKTFANYFQAKSKLFGNLLARSPKSRRFAAINVDDPWGQKLRRKIAHFNDIQKISFGISHGMSQVRAKEIQQNLSGVYFVLNIADQEIPIHLKLLGLHNVSNALAAASAAHALGFSLHEIKKGLENLAQIPGRLERILEAKDFLVLVDYAHSPDALENVIRALRGVDGVKRIITVFGCGGDRDKGKRPLMGQIATSLGDFAVVTSDNPRSEDPQAILRDIEAGIKSIKKTNFISIVDRAKAIRWALSHANPGDCVLVAGKGHETYQIFKDKTIHFDDREACRRGRS